MHTIRLRVMPTLQEGHPTRMGLSPDSQPKPLQNVHLPLAACCTPAETLWPYARFAAAPRRDFNRRAGQPGNGASLLLPPRTHLVDADPFGMAGGMIQNVTFEQIGIGVHPALHKLHHVEMHEFPAPSPEANVDLLKGVRYLRANHVRQCGVTRSCAWSRKPWSTAKPFVPAMLEAKLAVGPRRQPNAVAAQNALQADNSDARPQQQP